MNAPAGFADLHRHLDGSLRLATLEELSAQHKRPVPQDIYFHQGMGLAGALERFAVTLAVLQHPDSVRRVAREMCEDAAAHQTTTLEIRFAPQLHRGAAVQDIVSAAVEGAAGRAGLILCGLYGEPPETLEHLVEVAHSTTGVVGIDLAGGPGHAAPDALLTYAKAFTKAKDYGLGRTVHAAEGRPPHEIRQAIEHLHAQRIGHGTTLLDDSEVLDLVLANDITIEACISSNVHTGAIPHANAHPLAQWLSLGVKACICTDNTLFSDVHSPEEHALAQTLPGMTPQLLQLAIANGHAGAFRERR